MRIKYSLLVVGVFCLGIQARPPIANGGSPGYSGDVKASVVVGLQAVQAQKQAESEPQGHQRTASDPKPEPIYYDSPCGAGNRRYSYGPPPSEQPPSNGLRDSSNRFANCP